MMPCPGCGEEVPPEETCWLVRGRFYCGERCASRAYHRGQVLTRALPTGSVSHINR